MQGMMQKMQKMQKELEKAQQEINETEFTGTSQSDLVQVTVNGQNEVLSVKIKPEAVDVDDIELLEDLVLMATNDALQQVKTTTEEKIGRYTKGLKIPGL